MPLQLTVLCCAREAVFVQNSLRRLLLVLLVCSLLFWDSMLATHVLLCTLAIKLELCYHCPAQLVFFVQKTGLILFPALVDFSVRKQVKWTSLAVNYAHLENIAEPKILQVHQDYAILVFFVSLEPNIQTK